LTDRERTEREALTAMFVRNTDQFEYPEKYSPFLRRVDNMEQSPAAAIVSGTAKIVGANQQTQDELAALTRATGEVAFARSAAVSGGPAYTGAQGAPELSEPIALDMSKPYANPKNRPSYGSNQVQLVWENAQRRSSDGKVYDPNTGGELQWDTAKSRFGQWDMGHMPGNGYADLHFRYLTGEIGLDDFLREYRDPENYRPESPTANRGRRYENN
jgi:hypothetical protein